jgi:hypothetical protein
MAVPASTHLNQQYSMSSQLADSNHFNLLPSLIMTSFAPGRSNVYFVQVHINAFLLSRIASDPDRPNMTPRAPENEPRHLSCFSITSVSRNFSVSSTGQIEAITTCRVRDTANVSARLFRDISLLRERARLSQSALSGPGASYRLSMLMKSTQYNTNSHDI